VPFRSVASLYPLWLTGPYFPSPAVAIRLGLLSPSCHGLRPQSFMASESFPAAPNWALRISTDFKRVAARD
jgi:hypothetical protein